MRRSLRWRLSLAFTLLTTITMVALSVALLVSTEESEEELIDEVVNATFNGIEAQREHGQSFLLPSHLKFFHAPQGQVPAGMPAAIAHFPLGNHEWYGNGIEYHVGVRESGKERLYVLYDTQEHEDRLTDLGLNLLIGVVFLSALSLLLGHLLSGSLLAQLSRLAEQVRNDVALDETAALDLEVAVLAQAIHNSRQEKAQLLEREREFTSHVSHEIRTPLTRIRTSAELLSESPQLAATDTRRAGQIIVAVDELEAKLRSLLFLARETTVTLRDIDLHLAVVAALHRHEHFKPALPLINAVPSAARLMADADLLALLLDNLLANAVRHTETGEIRIAFVDNCLSVSDTGCGIPAEVLPHVFERHYRASTHADGQGLGLAIVARICEVSAWPYRIDSCVGQGTTISILTAPHKNLT